uniref:Uncharacterized protein n=1 Tax=Arundo donax TaxID=35708 RepID=A0A0A9FPD1_ARUDO
MILCSEAPEDIHVGLSDDRRKVHQRNFSREHQFQLCSPDFR